MEKKALELIMKHGYFPKAPGVLIFISFMGLAACAPQSDSQVSLWVDPITAPDASLNRSGRMRLSRVRPGRDWRQFLLSQGSGLQFPLASTDGSIGVNSGRIQLAESGDVTPPVACVGLNIMGANISSALGSEGSSAWKDYKKDVLDGDTCSYPGKVSNVVAVDSGGEITVAVPFGADRVIQLVGYSGLNCNGSLSAADLADVAQVPGAYELGREVADLFSSSPDIALDFDLTTLADIDTNEEAADVDEFVPDIRCQVKGEPEEQLEALLASVPVPESSPEAELPEEDEPVDETPVEEEVIVCGAGQYLADAGVCADVGLGFWSDGTDNLRYACTSVPPENAAYSSTVATVADCPWGCNAGYALEGDNCISQAGLAVDLQCTTGDTMVGILATRNASDGFVSLQIRCAQYNTNNGTGTGQGSSPLVGTLGGQNGDGATPVDFTCESNQVVYGISGLHAALDGSDYSVTYSIELECRDNAGASSSGILGMEPGGGTPYVDTCAADEHAVGIRAVTGPHLGVISELICAP